MKADLTAPGNWTYLESGRWEREEAERRVDELSAVAKLPLSGSEGRAPRRAGVRLGARIFIAMQQLRLCGNLTCMGGNLQAVSQCMRDSWAEFHSLEEGNSLVGTRGSTPSDRDRRHAKPDRSRATWPLARRSSG